MNVYSMWVFLRVIEHISYVYSQWPITSQLTWIRWFNTATYVSWLTNVTASYFKFLFFFKLKVQLVAMSQTKGMHSLLTYSKGFDSALKTKVELNILGSSINFTLAILHYKQTQHITFSAAPTSISPKTFSLLNSSPPPPQQLLHQTFKFCLIQHPIYLSIFVLTSGGSRKITRGVLKKRKQNSRGQPPDAEGYL